MDDRDPSLYDPKREDGLLHALQQALNADLAAMVRHNFQAARQFTWEEIAEKTSEVCRRCLRRGTVGECNGRHCSHCANP